VRAQEAGPNEQKRSKFECTKKYHLKMNLVLLINTLKQSPRYRNHLWKKREFQKYN
jgi:hypothetical protein